MKKSVYLIGAIEHMPDYGQTWRQDITPALKTLGYTVFDPTAKDPIYGRNEGEELHTYLKALKSSGEYTQIHKVMKEIVERDSLMLNAAEIMLCFWPKDVVSHGTSGEVTFAYESGKHIITVAPDGLHELPLWVQGCLNPYYVVETFEQALRIFERGDFR